MRNPILKQVGWFAARSSLCACSSGVRGGFFGTIINPITRKRIRHVNMIGVFVRSSICMRQSFSDGVYFSSVAYYESQVRETVK